jgi:HD-GYP domain-containing protein (c-di-GMP phosphodiesterase class II)
MIGPGDERTTVREQLAALHGQLRRELPELRRVAVALHDADSGQLRTFLHSTDGPSPLRFHEVALADVPSLADLADSGADRVVADLELFRGGDSLHTRRLLEYGYRSSFTRPFFERGHLLGFVFFDSDRVAYFDAVPRHRLGTLSELVALRVAHGLAPARLLRSALSVVREIARLRDDETGRHLERVAAYSRLIALEVAAREGRDDAFVEFVHLFAPLHDIGKIGIPDRILLKPDRLAAGEREIMRQHVQRGLDLVSRLAGAFGVDDGEQLTLLRNIVAGHHECVDGSGYPDGLAGRDIPLEARIVAVADVFDALTTERPYKPAWDNELAFAQLDEMAGHQLHAECVHALVTRRAEVEAIQRRHAVDPVPLPQYA